ncbi:stage III sporulation protein AF [Lutispora sp.]|uniref:stage III sporulation protein AF n=1 Tax=Lutispora sp. TaxID=2828727 RepID=UPI0035616C25
MIEFLRNWVINIVIIIIFVIITDVVLPEGNIKKYVRVIIGTFVLLTIIKPFISITDLANDFERTYIETNVVLNTDKKLLDKEVLNSYQNAKAIEIYESRLKDQIASAVSYKASVDKKNIDVSLDINKNQNSNDFGLINSVIVIIYNQKKGDKIEKIKKVRIGEEEKVIYNEVEEYNFNEKTSTADIRNMLSEILGINKDKVQVKLFVEMN